MRKSAPISLKEYLPGTEAGKEELARRMADLHAAVLEQRLKELTCSASQKLDLLNAVMEDMKKEKSSELP